MRRLRRDLLVDLAAAVLLTITVVIITAGLGVIALIEVPVAAIVIGTFVLERRRRRREQPRRPR